MLQLTARRLVTMEPDSIIQDFKFVDEASYSTYGCSVCSNVCKQAQLAQCCGAIYCKQCAEIAESSASIQAERETTHSSDIIQSNPSASICCKCKNSELELASDILFQDTIRKLQVECLKPGCGWMGILGDMEAHMKEPHENDLELYDNDFLLEGESLEPQSPPPEQSSTKFTPPPHTTTDSTPKNISEPKTEEPSHVTGTVDYRTLQSASSVPQLEEQMSTDSSSSKRENMCLRFYSSTHSGVFADLSTSEKL